MVLNCFPVAGVTRMNCDATGMLLQLRTRKRTAIICAIVWAVAAIMSLPVMIYSQLEEVTGELKCRIMFPGYKPFADTDTYIDYGIIYDDSAFNYSSNDLIGLDFFVSTVPSAEEPVYYETCSHAVKSHQYRIWLVVSFVLSFVVPFSIITVSYVLILKRLRASEERIATMTGKRTQNMRRKVTRMVAVLVVCFVICWLPYHILQLCKIKGFQASVMICNVVEQFVVALAFANSAINPILYSFLGHNFGERLRESVNHTRRRLRRGSSATGVSGHQTRSHTEHAGHSLFPRRFSQLVGFRRGYRNSASGEGNPVQIDDNYHSEGRRVKFGIPLRDLNKKRERQYEKTENATAFTSNPTELTRVTVDKETPKKSSFSEADTV
ncbi:uncharacterized protein LOC143470163 isoform X1 [Clavelina lepadiformis]|uniref:uncharacterized protein LOC143470163 isoform X1 n=2 Tax=Clavelina lepadiformis TaxID=159417 RepID=UPI0040418DAB